MKRPARPGPLSGSRQTSVRPFGGSRQTSDADALSEVWRLPLRSRRYRHSGFTLLELLLATVAAAMLMSAFYMAMNITMVQTEAARDASGTEDLVRGVFNRMSIDIGGTLGMQAPNSGGQLGIANMYLSMSVPPGTAVSTGSSTGSGSGSGSGAGGTTGGSSTASSTASSTSSSTSSTSTAGSGASILGMAYLAPEIGVVGGYQGNQNMLILFVSKVPDLFTTTDANSLAQLYSSNSSTSISQYPADLRRVVYWLGGSGGLYRHETPWVTGIDSWNLSDLPMADENGVQVAKEVTNVVFEYFDPIEMQWETSWDGTGSSSPPYSLTPGPPSAIRVTLTFSFENPKKGGNPISSTTQQIFPIYPAGGVNPEIIQLTLYDPLGASGTTSSSSSSSGSGSGGGAGGAGGGKTGG